MTRLILGLLVFAATPAFCQSFVAPPRTIADITAIIDQEKPDPNVAAKLRVDANAEPPAGTDQATLARFYYDRSHARAALGDHRAALADAEQAAELARTSLELPEQGRIKQQVALQYAWLGHPRKALEVLRAIVREHAGTKGWMINSYRLMVGYYVQMGNFEQADNALRGAEALIQEVRKGPVAALVHGD